MRFEFAVAAKYLIPRAKQLSVSIISMVSLLVISLVIWLVLVFLSVTDGLEKTWIDKLVSISAPLRLTPTEKYYQSTYYNIDSISAKSHYRSKTLKEKLHNEEGNPYDPSYDAEIPPTWLPLDLKQDGTPKDIVKETYALLFTHNDVIAEPFQVGLGQFRLNLGESDNFITQMAYFASFPEESPNFLRTIQKPNNEELGPNLIQVGEKHFLPEDDLLGEGVLVAKQYKDSGVKLGDTGYLSYSSATTSSVQEMRVPLFVAGFYDPGITPLGGKLIMVRDELVSQLHQTTNRPLTTGLQVWFDDTERAIPLKKTIEKELSDNGLSQYWNVESYQEYDFAKDLVQQLKSDKTLFTLMALIIIIVACSNIISMLILLVNDKKKEIGILQSMGATPKSIAMIFGLCGLILGLASSVIGTMAAFWTLNNIQLLIDFLSALQGHNAFNTAFFGDKLPNAMSHTALIMVWTATTIISLLAGLIPALKASSLKPTAILRSE